jgi:hypothetical protein
MRAETAMIVVLRANSLPCAENAAIFFLQCNTAHSGRLIPTLAPFADHRASTAAAHRVGPPALFGNPLIE